MGRERPFGSDDFLVVAIPPDGVRNRAMTRALRTRRSMSSHLFLVACAVAGPLSLTARAASPAHDAGQLVEAALQAELAGDDGQRGELLKQAVAANPDDAAARWQSGHVQIDGQWRTVAEIAEESVGNKRRAEYDELRAPNQRRSPWPCHAGSLVRLGEACAAGALPLDEGAPGGS